MKAKKKIILVTLDTVRADHLSTYGYKSETDPKMKEFSENARVYENAYAPIPLTLPSHMSIFSGVSPNNFGLITEDFPNYKETLPELFGAKGYKTAGFVSASQLYRSTIKRGFETFRYDVKNQEQEPRLDGARTNQAVIQWLGENKDKNFFLWVHYYDAHSPYNPCKTDYFSKGLDPTRKELKSLETRDYKNTNLGLTENDMNYLVANYDEGIRCADNSFGGLVDYLKKAGIYDDATVAVVGDHGENFDHDTVFHGNNIYESAVKVPLILKSPFIKTGRESRNVSEMDIYKTLTGIFDLKYSGKLTASKDLRKPDGRRTLYFQTDSKIGEVGNNNGAKSDSYMSFTSVGSLEKSSKYIYTISDKKIEKYDLSKDTEEATNLFTKKTSEIKARLNDIGRFFRLNLK